METTVSRTKELFNKGWINTLQATIVIPYPGTALFSECEKNGWLKTEESIPVGALVFWHWTTFGHIGIYSGDGKVVHTGVKASLKMNGVRESLLQDITDVLGEESYAGWAYPPENWLK